MIFSVQVFIWTHIFNFWEQMPKWNYHRIAYNSMSVFLKNNQIVSVVVVLFYILTRYLWSFQLLYILGNTWY